MTSELRFLNALIGFCLPSGGTWPSPLGPLGYVPCGVEREITIVLGGRDRKLPIDLICASPDTNHALCFEAKSATLHEDQVRRYQALTPLNLLRLGALPPTIQSARLTHDVAYVADRAGTASLLRQFAAIDTILPLVAGDEERFDLAQGSFGQPAVQRLFADGILVDARAWPRHFVPFKSDSPIEEMVPGVVQALAAFIIAGRDFTVTEVAEQSVPHWRLCGDAERQRFRTRLADLTDRATREQLSDYLERPGAPQAWHPTSGRLTRPTQLERLKRLSVEFVARVQGGEPARPIQTPLPFTDQITPETVDEDDLLNDEAE